MTNCTLAGNVTGFFGGGLYNGGSATVTNCIGWGNSPDTFNGLSIPVVVFSCVEGGFDGEGNIDSDPLFVDPNNGNYRLSPGSPCIDAGDNLAVPRGIEFDLDGNPRFVDDPCADDTGNGERPIVDMGAFEFQGTSCDIDGDGTVGASDLLILLVSWGPCADCGNCPADLDGDCTVGASDLLILLANWG